MRNEVVYICTKFRFSLRYSFFLYDFWVRQPCRLTANRFCFFVYIRASHNTECFAVFPHCAVVLGQKKKYIKLLANNVTHLGLSVLFPSLQDRRTRIRGVFFCQSLKCQQCNIGYELELTPHTRQIKQNQNFIILALLRRSV